LPGVDTGQQGADCGRQESIVVGLVHGPTKKNTLARTVNHIRWLPFIVHGWICSKKNFARRKRQRRPRIGFAGAVGSWTWPASAVAAPASCAPGSNRVRPCSDNNRD